MSLTSESNQGRRANLTPNDATFVDNVNGEVKVQVQGEVQLYDANGVAITLSDLGGGGGSAGGGNIVYTNAAGDFTAVANDSTKTITITGLSFTLEDINVAAGSIKKITTAGVVSSVDVNNIAVTAGVITLSEADDFVTTDTVLVTLVGPDKGYDRSLDTSKNIVQNPEWAHYTDVEHIVDETDTDVSTNSYFYSPEIFVDGYRNLALQFTGSTGGSGVIFKIFGTLNSSAATPAAGVASTISADWMDMSDLILAATSITLDSGASELYFVDTPMMPYKYIIEYVIDNATSTTDIFSRKH